VINAQGKISFPAGSEQFNRQKSKLLAEGVQFSGTKIPLAEYGL
jgi:methylated-DNA-protein-cysteine methyltransferase-like protein